MNHQPRMINGVIGAMLVLAVHRAHVAASRSMLMVPLTRTSTLAFSVLSARTFNHKRQTKAHHTQLRMVSSAADVEVSSDPSLSPQNTNGGGPLYTVMVKRNRQSAAFREGTPLIFGGSIASTFTEYCDDSTTSEADAIPMGALVSVVVSRDSSKGGGKKGGKRNSRSSDREENASTPHHAFHGDDAETKYRDMINQSQLIGYGVFNPESMYRVRVLCHETMHPRLAKEIRSIRKSIQRGTFPSEEDGNSSILRLILERKVSDAFSTRIAMDLPSDGITDTYRICNGEGDGLSGLAIDILGGSTAIVMSSAAWCEIHKDVIVSVLEKSLKEHPSYEGQDLDIVWRNTPSRLKQDGYDASSESGGDYAEESETSVVATETSVKYLTHPYSDGQKTGFYCDQRENRLMVAELCQNKRVLDLCCYNGGFALNAMIRGSAASAIGVDSSQDAVDAAAANAELNGLSEKNVSFVKDDIGSFMKSGIEAKDEYDVIVLDPPKLAPSLSSLDKASRKYHALNRDAMNLINKSQGGLLLTCTCSAAMTQKDGGQYFLNMVNGAALSARRRVTLLRVSGAAPCHTQSPASFPAGAYLTAALFHVGPADV